ncbi:hypothetical protein MBLNU459_g7493t1 [Dothideomycetes sp. NU459]
MATALLAFLGFAFAIGTITYLAINENQRDVIFKRFYIGRSRAKDSYTPPRSLSPAKQGIPEIKLPEGQEYRDTFPPCRRSALANISDRNFCVDGKSAQALSELPHDTTKCVPDKENALAAGNDHLFTPTGFSVAEIKALGDFPDYAALSGVPLPNAYPEFDINTAMPRPYRPIRWAYHQTMSFKKMEPDWWLELEKTYVARIKQRQDLYAKYGKMVLQELPGSEIACKELMEICLQFLCARYPQYFRLDKEKMVFHNGILKNETHLKDMSPLLVILNNVPEDFAMVLRDPETGYYSFRAGVVCSSLGWNVGTKIGMTLKEIHEPIPDYKEKMEFSMDRYFAKKPTEKPIQRGSWGLEIDEPLFMPPGDPHEHLRQQQDPTHDISRCNLRVDWQTLRRLPLSAAVVFNFKALFTPVQEFRDEPRVPSVLLKVLREGKKSLMEYKGTWHTEHVVIPALEQYEKEQIEKGLVEPGWEPHTLDEYPYFSGWEEKWHAQQGF